LTESALDALLLLDVEDDDMKIPRYSTDSKVVGNGG
jgi:hypothetical protein